MHLIKSFLSFVFHYDSDQFPSQNQVCFGTGCILHLVLPILPFCSRPYWSIFNGLHCVPGLLRSCQRQGYVVWPSIQSWNSGWSSHLVQGTGCIKVEVDVGRLIIATQTKFHFYPCGCMFVAIRGTIEFATDLFLVLFGCPSWTMVSLPMNFGQFLERLMTCRG